MKELANNKYGEPVTEALYYNKKSTPVTHNLSTAEAPLAECADYGSASTMTEVQAESCTLSRGIAKMSETNVSQMLRLAHGEASTMLSLYFQGLRMGRWHPCFVYGHLSVSIHTLSLSHMIIFLDRMKYKAGFTAAGSRRPTASCTPLMSEDVQVCNSVKLLVRQLLLPRRT